MKHRMTLAAFEEACIGGVAVQQRLSCRGLGSLPAPWPDIMRAVIRLGRVHPAAQMQFLDTWSRVGGGFFAPAVGDDDLLYAGLRLLLPPYDGGPMRLYRGQRENDRVGMSWTRSEHVARKFALFGTLNVPVHNLDWAKARREPYEDGVILETTVCKEIICAPCLLGHKEGEYIIDSRGVAIITKRAADGRPCVPYECGPGCGIVSGSNHLNAALTRPSFPA